MSSTQRFPSQQLKQLRANVTLISTTLKNLTAAVQVLSDTLSGVNVSNATSLNPHFNTVTAGDLYYLDNGGSALSVETQLATKADTSTLPTLYVSKSNPTVSGTLNIGTNNISFTDPNGITQYIDKYMLQSLCTNYTIWKTSYPTIDLTPYVTNTSLTTTLISYAKSTDLNAYVSNTSLTTTLGA